MSHAAESLHVPARPVVTVVMPIRNESAHIGRSLGAVFDQDYPRDALEVIVADGMSTDGTRVVVRALQAHHPNLKLIDNPEKIVPCGLNLAIGQARGEIIVRVDGHTIISPDYVSRCVAALERTGADTVGGAMRSRGDTWFGEGVALATSSPFGVGGARFHYSEREENVDTVYMGAWRLSTFGRLGLFDEEMVRDQDDEFNYRVLERGGRVVLVPDVRSIYTVRGSPRSLWRQYFQYGFWKVRVIQKHPGRIRPRHAAPSVFVTALAGSILASGFDARAAALSTAITVSYGLANLGFSALIARRGRWRHLPAISLAFAIIHVAYGVGLLTGLGRFVFGSGAPRRTEA